MSSKPRVVVVGAGLAGLACARTLADRGASVTVLDKGRTPGGRATSRTAAGRVFDHGAQFFTARGAWLSGRVGQWEREGVVARWSPRMERAAPEPWWVGTPRMGALAAHLARDLDVRLGTTVASLVDCRREHGADALVVAIPAVQCASLLAPISPLAREVSGVVQTPCWAVMLAIRTADLGADVFEDREGAIAWAAREGSKPGRVAPEGEDLWTLHASTAWSEAHLEDSPESVAEALTTRFLELRAPGAAVLEAKAHRWRYARGRADAPKVTLFDEAARVVVCGDWLEAARVESALASGVAAADHLVR